MHLTNLFQVRVQGVVEERTAFQGLTARNSPFQQMPLKKKLLGQTSPLNKIFHTEYPLKGKFSV